jgi:RNA processing factor Prp31
VDKEADAVGSGSEEPAEQLQLLIDELNRRSMHDDLRPNEIMQIRELLPQIRELVEARKRLKWLLKSVGMFLLAAPAVTAVWQAFIKIVEWIRNP